MGLTDGCRWSILQVVAIILCCRGSASYSTLDTMHLTDERSTDDESGSLDLETTTYEIQTTIQGDAMHSTSGEKSERNERNYSSPGSEPNPDEGQNKIKGDANDDSTADKQSIGRDVLGPATEAESRTDVGQTTKAMSEETPIAGIVICCLIILLVISILVVALYQRRKTQQTKSFQPAAMAEAGNRTNETDAHAAQGTSQQNSNHPMALYSVIEEAPAVDSEVKQTEATSKDDKSDGVAKDETKEVDETQTMGLNVYTTTVDKPSTTASTDSTLEADQVGVSGVADKGDSSPNQVYSLASDMDSINAKETAVDSSAPQLDAGAVSKPATPQDDGCQTVIENDLYGKADNCAKEIAVESPPSLLLTGL